ncbi:MAG: hypothetical protein HY876_01380 [Coriobacteriales bacterium]|nr:hypothetical protein [Coriobacteriales bacterium]
MIVHKKTLAVSTAALLMTGGVAYAFINATTVSGSGTAGTANASTALVLTPGAGSVNPFSSTPSDRTVPVVAANSSTIALMSPSSSAVNVTVTLDGPHAACPAGSFTATFTAVPVSVAAGASNIAVGSATVVYNDLPVDQSSCVGAVLTLGFSTPVAP